MEGVLYFPYIEVPDSGWFTRTLLYWDQVGTIVPNSYIEAPERLSPYMLELVQSELVREVEPFNTNVDALRPDFYSYLTGLSSNEMDERREAFQLDEVARVHRDKFVGMGVDVYAIEQLGLARTELGGESVQLERRTASEFMAALALKLCEPGQAWQADADGWGMRWVPTTDRSEAAQALVSGLAQEEDATPLFLRIQGHVQTDEVRVKILDRMLPVPTGPVPVDRIVRFRRKYGDLLPRLRRHLEREVDSTAGIENPAMQQRQIDRLTDELTQMVGQAEAYLNETFQRRIAGSRVLRWAKYLPVVSHAADATRDVADSLVTQADFRMEPLAYLAFAHTEFGPKVPPFKIDPMTGRPISIDSGAESGSAADS
jgi:hypothetical protein